MTTRILGVAALMALALSQAASAHARRHDHMQIDRDYQAVSPYAQPLPAWPARTFPAPSDDPGQTLTGGPAGGLGS